MNRTRFKCRKVAQAFTIENKLHSEELKKVTEVIESVHGYYGS